MRYLKECKQCKRKFRTTRKDKVYCSRKCFSAGASESYVKKRNTQGQLCVGGVRIVVVVVRGVGN